jgi:hemin uptake protein HemP
MYKFLGTHPSVGLESGLCVLFLLLMRMFLVYYIHMDSAYKEQNSSQRSVPVIDNTVASIVLLGEKKSLVIEHKGERYQLRETRQGKLILTK